MSNEKDFLGKEPIGKLLMRLALPTVAAQLINMLYNIVDRIYIGHIPEVGALALTGVGVCMPLIMIVSAFAALVGNGGAPRASIFMGKGDNSSSEKILGNCFFLQVIISVVLTAILLIWNRDFLLAFGASENTIEYGVQYMNIYAIGTIFVQLTLGMNAFITAQGFAKTGMLSVLIGAAANIILDPILIFGFNMGVRGAALATIISQACSCVWVIAFLFGKKTTLKIRRRNLGLQPDVILPCLALGVSVFIMQASESIISVCFNSSLLKYGGDIAVGAMTILTSVMQFAMLPLQGLGQGAQPIISYNYGAGNVERVKKSLQTAFKGQPELFGDSLAVRYAFPSGVCGHVYIRCGTVGIYKDSAACVYGCIVPFWYTDGLSDDIQFPWKCESLYCGGGDAEICASDSADLYHAFNSAVQPDDGSIYGRADRRLFAVSFTAVLFTFQFKKALRFFDDK